MRRGRAGTQTIWASLMQIPNTVLNAATGIPESTFTELKKYPLVVAPGTGGEACMAKCGIDFQTVSSAQGSVTQQQSAVTICSITCGGDTRRAWRSAAPADLVAKLSCSSRGATVRFELCASRASQH